MGTTQSVFTFLSIHANMSIPNWNLQVSPPTLIALHSSSRAPYAWKHILDPISVFSPSSPNHEHGAARLLMTSPCNIPGVSWPHTPLPGSLTLVLQGEAQNAVSGEHVPAAAPGLNHRTHSRNASSGLRCPAHSYHLFPEVFLFNVLPVSVQAGLQVM